MTLVSGNTGNTGMFVAESECTTTSHATVDCICGATLQVELRHTLHWRAASVGIRLLAARTKLVGPHRCPSCHRTLDVDTAPQSLDPAKRAALRAAGAWPEEE